MLRALECPNSDEDGDCDVDVADYTLMLAEFTGPLTPAVFVETGELASAASRAGSYFSDGNDLAGIVWQAGSAAASFVTTW